MFQTDERPYNASTRRNNNSFKIRTGSGYSRRLNKVSKNIKDSFMESTIVNKALSLKRTPVAKGVVMMKNLTEKLKKQNPEMLLDGYESELQKLNKLKEEVKALPSVVKPISDPEAYNMILNQRRERRMQHINELHDFENVIKGVKDKSQNKITEIKKQVEAFETGTGLMIDGYLNSVDKEHMTEREDDIVNELHGFVEDIEQRMLSKLENINNNLDECEDFFYDNIQQEVDDLRDTLIDIAFVLKPEVIQITENIRKTFKDDIESGKVQNKEYYEALEKRIKLKIEDTKSIALEREAQWRKIKHDMVMNDFTQEINSEKIRHPQDRVRDYKLLNDFFDRISKTRLDKIEYLKGIPAGDLTKARMEKFLTEIRKINEESSIQFGQYVERMMSIKKNHIQKLNDFIEYIKSRIEHYNADLGEETTRESLYKEKIDSQLEEIDQQMDKIIENIIDFIEERDTVQHQVCLNLGHSYMKFGKRMDKYTLDYSVTEHNFGYEKGILEEKNEEALIKLSKELDDCKSTLRKSKDHLVLDDNLEKCFSAVEVIEDEFRNYHAQNVDVVKKHAPFIQEMFDKLEDDFSTLMDLKRLTERLDLEKRAEAITKWKAKVKTDLTIAEQAKKEEEELEKLIEDNKDNKKFKLPKKKAKNEKQMKAEWLELFNTICQDLKVLVVQIDDIGTGNPRLVDKSMEAFVKSLYYPSKDEALTELTEEEKQKIEEDKKIKEKELEEQKRIEEEEAQDPKKKKAAAKDQIDEIVEVNDPESVEEYKIQNQMPIFENGQQIFSSDFQVDINDLTVMIQVFRQTIFEFLANKKRECLDNAEVSDQDFIETSLILLDERLKNYYPLRGKIQTDVFMVRSGEITFHKSSYEKFISEVLDALDEQTDRFNFYYSEIFDEKKTHTEYIKQLIKTLPDQKELTSLQSQKNNAIEADLKFGELMRATFGSMEALSQAELDNILLLIERELSTYKNSDEYFEDEISWYENMLGEIRTKIENHRVKRKEILSEIQELCENRKKEILEKIEDAYDIAVDELSARDAKGPIFGEPVRLSQKIVREELTLCQSVQAILKNNLTSIKQNIEDGYIGTLSIRAQLVSFRESCLFYGRYLEAFKEESPLTDFPRISYNEVQMGIAISDEEKEEDEKRSIDELKQLQRFYYRGNDLKFEDKINELENAIKDKTAAVYTGEYSKLLGPDKLTDVLRSLMEETREEMDQFKIDAIRQLRLVTNELVELGPAVSRLIYQSLHKKVTGKISQENQHVDNLFDESLKQSIKLRELHIVQLRPNLNHPDNVEELEELNNKEKERNQIALKSIETYSKEVKDLWFNQSNILFVSLLNNFEFLQKFFDCWILHEDYIKLPGDESLVKKHLSLRKLLIKKKKGELTDTSSLRSIKKSWKVYELNMFSIDEKVFEFKVSGELEDPVEGKDKKKDKKKKAPAKKQGKGKVGKGAKDSEPEEGQKKGFSKPITSFKSSMQKGSFNSMNSLLSDFKAQFDQKVEDLIKSTEKFEKDEYHFEFFWQTTNRRLFEDSI